VKRGARGADPPMLTVGEWQIRLELEQLGAGELVGVGSIARTTHPRVSEVIVGGSLEGDGIARLRLDPIHRDDQAPLALLVRVASHPDTADPMVTEVLEVCAMPAR
jgi:hypothetical protein